MPTDWDWQEPPPIENRPLPIAILNHHVEQTGSDPAPAMREEDYETPPFSVKMKAKPLVLFQKARKVFLSKKIGFIKGITHQTSKSKMDVQQVTPELPMLKILTT